MVVVLVLGGGAVLRLAEHAVEGRYRGEAGLHGHVGDRHVRAQEKRLGRLHAALVQVVVIGLSRELFKQPRKMKF